eukprot:1160646-Pelagomonas_calceolata.AAC.2
MEHMQAVQATHNLMPSKLSHAYGQKSMLLHAVKLGRHTFMHYLPRQHLLPSLLQCMLDQWEPFLAAHLI